MYAFLGYLAIGAAAGFFAGMLGIGGGGIIVPLLVMLFQAEGLPKAHLLHLAVGTAMATILFTSVSSVRAHAARGAIRWDIGWKMTPGILAGGWVGSALAAAVSTRVFAALFAAVIYAAGVHMLLDLRVAPRRRTPGWAGMSAAGFLISALSSLAAIGGAFMTVPFLLWCNVPLLSAIGSAAMVGFPIALAGSAGYAVSGLHSPGLPPWSLGYIYLPALAGIVVASMLTAPVGAAAAHRMPTRWLRRIFAALLFALATRMLASFW